MKKKRNVISTAILVVLLLVGLSVMLYPTVSDWWNSRVQTRAIATYNQSVEQMDTGDKERLLMEAHSYNATLSHLTAPFTNWRMPETMTKSSTSAEPVSWAISLSPRFRWMPIYHGTSAEVLNVAVGHLQGSSFPVGGENTHAVISAHRGLPSAKLFSDLDQLVEGDTFTVTILDEVLTYEVEKISSSNPTSLTSSPSSPAGLRHPHDLYPYGVNSHRLLVRAHRVDTVYPHNVKVAADAVQLDSMSVVPFIAAPLFVGLLVFWIVSSKRQKTRSRRELLAKLKEPEKKEGD